MNIIYNRLIWIAACIALAVIPQTALHAQCYTLFWQDEFEGEAIDNSRWNVLDDNSGGGNQELQYYTTRDTNVYLEDGKLIIRALEEEYGGRHYTSGKLTTKGLADWRYGRMEARIRLPEGQGIWPAFWMMPAENIYGTWPNSGEIDIMELVGHEPSRVYGTIHYGPPWDHVGGNYTLSEGKYSDSAFLFAIEWDETRIDWFVNDILYSTKAAGDLHTPDLWKLFRERFYLILNLAVGGNWPGDPDETTVFPQTLEVDYVRVYGDPAHLEIIAEDSAHAGAKGVRYRIMDIPGASFAWTVPADAVIVSGQGTSVIEVDWGCTEGDVQLTVSDIDCEDQLYTLPVGFSETGITGPSALLQLESAVFSIPEFLTATYTWTFPEDATPLHEPDDTLVLQWGCGDGYVAVSFENSCGSFSDSVWVAVRDPLLTGPSRVSQTAAGVLYTVEPVPASTYAWSVPPDAAVAEGQGTDAVRVDFGMEGGAVSVSVTNSCGVTEYTIPVTLSDTITIVDFETTSYPFSVFAGSTFETVENPSPDAVNPSATAGKTYKTEVTWAGIYADLGFNLDLDRHKKFLMSVYGPKTGQVLFKLEDNDGGTGQTAEVGANLTVINQWQELEFIFPDAATDLYDRITLFFDFGSAVKNFYHFDDILLVPYEIIDHAEDGLSAPGIRVYPNPFGDRLTVSADEQITRLEIYSMDGSMLTGRQYSAGQATLDVTGLPPGVYVLKVTSGNAKTGFVRVVKEE